MTAERPPLPTNHEAEQAVVGGVLRAADAVHQLGFLRRSDFADELLGAVYDAVRGLAAAGNPTDWRAIASLWPEPDKLGAYLRSLLQLAPPELALADLARSVRDLADRRRLIQLAEEVAEQARDGGTTATDLAAGLVAEIGREIGDAGEDVATVGTLAQQVVEALPRELPCSSTGIAALDDALGGGLYAGKVYGLVARMKTGKTILAGTIAYNAAVCGAKVLYLPLEMGAEELTQRMLARRMACNSLAFLDRRRRQDARFVSHAGEAAVELARLPLLFQARPRMALDDLRQTIARAAMRDRAQGVVLDYLQLVTGQGRNQSQASFLDDVTQALAEAAKRFGLWVLAVAQENQVGNVRGGEGLLNACDATLQLHRVEGVGNEPERAWIEMKVSRYTLRRNVGSEADPALLLDTRAGPHFVEILPGAAAPVAASA